jgi:hypothetical protein
MLALWALACARRGAQAPSLCPPPCVPRAVGLMGSCVAGLLPLICGRLLVLLGLPLLLNPACFLPVHLHGRPPCLAPSALSTSPGMDLCGVQTRIYM